MARIQRIQKARKTPIPRRCVICGYEVQPGEPYKKVVKRVGPRGSLTLNFCKAHDPKPSHLLSGRNQELAEITEGFEDDMGLLDQHDNRSKYTTAVGVISAAVEAVRDSIETMADEIETGASNIEEGFGTSTTQSEAMEETAEELTKWKDSLTEFIDELPSTDELTQCPKCDGPLPDPNARKCPDEDCGETFRPDLGDLERTAWELFEEVPELNLTG